MIQHWSKTLDASNNIVWKKENVDSKTITDANEILVTNPEVTDTPDNLNSVLGKMKANINELYGNNKWLALHGGGGAGTSGGTSGGESDSSTKTNTPYLSLVEIDANGESPLTSNGTVSVSNDTYTLGIYLYNAEADTDYIVSVTGGSNVFLLNKTLTKVNNYVEVKINGIESAENIRLVCTLKDSNSYSYPSTYLTLNYASVSVTALLVQDNSEITSGTSVTSKDITSDFEVTFGFTTSIIGGTISYVISAPSLYNDEDESFLKSGNVENGDEITVNFSENYNFQVSRSYEITLTAKVNSLVSGQIVTLASKVFRFTAQKLNEDDLFITFSDKRWKLLENSYDENIFEDGQDAILDSVLVGNKSYYSDIYYIAKFYYEKENETNELVWEPISTETIQGYGYFVDEIDSTPDFTTNESLEAYKAVSTPTEKKSWLVKYSSVISAWETQNKLRNFSITNNYGTQSNVTVSYAILNGIGDVFNFSEETETDEDGNETTSDKFISNNGGKIAHIRADLFAINLNIDNPEHIIIPIDSEGNYIPTISVKTRIRKSSVYVPDYVKGIQHGIKLSTSETEYVETESRFFNFDPINQKTNVRSTLNTLTDAKFVNTQNNIKIPMYLVNCNGNTKGKGNSGIVDVTKTSEYNNKTLTLNGESISNTYSLFRVSGNSYGLINYDSEFTKGLNFSGSSVKTKGFTIELCFQSDWHPHNEGTVFSMGSYTADGTLVTGINVDLEEATFTISENVDNKTASSTIKLIQNEFTQLDFVYEYSKVGSGNSVVEYGIIKIYQNGICTGIANLTYPTNSDLVFSTLTNGITIGCKAIKSSSSFGDNFTDANIFGLRMYNQALTDCEIIKNWMISNACANLGWEAKDDGTYGSVIDYTNVVSPQLKRNYFNDNWVSTIWDYGNGKNDTTKVASGQELFDRLSAWIQPEKGDGYRILPIVYLHNNNNICSTNNQSSDSFYKVYNETNAAINNKYIEKGNFSSCFQGIFDYYDTTTESPISSESAMGGNLIAWYMQGTSTQGYRSKNLEVCFEYDKDDNTYNGDLGWTKEGVGLIDGGGEFLFTPKPSSWLPENRFTLKADIVDSAHANNAAIGSWINSSGFMPKNPAQQDETYEYADFIKPTLEGFPVLVFVNWGYKFNADGTKDESFQTKNGIQFLGIYSFNLGRGSYYNLGFKKFKKYELQGNTDKSVTDDDYENWANPKNCEHASFVKRYLVEEENPNIFSFESTSNEPVGAVSFEQPNLDLIKSLWDIKYTSSTDDNIGYNRLKNVIKNIAYFNDDNLNYFETSSIPTYYYSSGSLTSTGNIGLITVLRNVDNFAEYQIGTSVPTGTTTETESNGDKIYIFPSGSRYKEDYLTWYEGLRDYENGDFSCEKKNTTRNSKGQYEIYDASGNFLSCFYNLKTGKLNNNYFPDRTTATEDVARAMGYYAYLSGGKYVQYPDKSPKMDEEEYLTQWIHYTSFSRYFDIAMVFGMVDSLGKNFTLRSWNITDANHGTLLPAFYDMDTALGLDNAGAENVEPTVYMDYWLTQNTNNGTYGMSSLHIFTEDVPYVESDNNYFYFYDKQGGTLLSQYSKTENYPALPQNSQYDLPSSHLWHVIRFMPELYSGLDDYNSGAGSATVYSVPAFAPLGQYTELRSHFLHSVDDFFEKYYLKHNENVGEFIFNLDYQEKYQTAYKKDGDTTLTYGDMKFCHGRRTSYVKQWLNTRITFLDSVMNLGHKLTLCNATTKGGIEYLRNYESTGTADRYFYHDPNAKSLSSELTSLNPVYITETSNKIGKSTSTSGNSYLFTLTTNENVMIIISFTNTTYHCFIRKNVPTLFKITGFKANSPGLSFNVNATAAISKWESFKSLNIYNFNSKASGAFWNLIEFDLSPDTELGVLGNSLQQADALKIEGMTELRDLNLSGISSGDNKVTNIDLSSMLKLQTLDISNSNIESISFPSGGNLKTLKIKGATLLTADPLSLTNLGSLEGTLDLTDCKNIGSLVLENCPKLENIIFGNNNSLQSISIKDCPGLTEFIYSGQEEKDAQGNIISTSLVTEISLTGDCSGIKTFNVSNISDESLTIDISGCTNLTSISMTSLETTNMPILPEYYVKNSEELERTDYPIYNSNTVTIALSNINFPGFVFGTNNDNAIVTYSTTYGDETKYPEVKMHASTSSDTTVNTTSGEYKLTYSNGTTISNIILNCAVFKRVKSVSLIKCPYIKYLATKFDSSNKVDGLNLSNMSNLERVFGYYPVYNSGPVFGFKSNPKFRISDWNQYRIESNCSTLEVKEMFESVLDGNNTLSDFEKLMHDVTEDTQEIQGVIPATRLYTINGNNSLESAFNNTSISMNDVYYIMLLLNLTNKERKEITSFAKAFASCGSIYTSYNKNTEEDLSPSHYLFRELYTVNKISNMFSGDNNITGILYSPDYRYKENENQEFDVTCIGTLTPLTLSCSAFKDFGWNLSYYDNYTYWTPKGEPVYYDDSLTYTGVCEKIANIDSLMNNVNCITSAIYKKIDFDGTYFKSDLILQPFKKATTVSSSFNNILVDFGESNATGEYNGKTYTYSTMFKNMTSITSIKSSFNFKLAQGTVVVDLFASNPYSLINEPNDYPNNISIIENSFIFSCSSPYAYFAMTDDMFQRIASTLNVVSPVTVTDYPNYSISLDKLSSIMFSGDNIIKTYVKYDTPTNALFPYEVFKNCSNLEHAPAFFAKLDLRYYVDAKSISHILTMSDFESPKKFSVAKDKGETGYLLDVTIPDYYASKPYLPVQKQDEETEEHSADIRMFKDTSKLKNICILFAQMTSPRMSFEIGDGDAVETKYIPGGFVVTPNAFKGLSLLNNIQYAFADNHYFKGQIPYGLLYTGTTETEKAVIGTDDLSKVYSGIDQTLTVESDFNTLRYNLNNDNITKGTKGIVELANNVYGGYVYIPDDDTIEDCYVVSTTTDENEVIHYDTITYDGVVYPKFVESDPYLATRQRYKKVTVSTLPWYQTYDSVDETIETETRTFTYKTNSQNISNISGLFSKNDAAGFLVLRCSNDYDSYTNIYSNPNVDDTTYLTRSEMYKWNGYSDKDFVHTQDSSFTNKNLYTENKNYSTFKLLVNDNRNIDKTVKFENIVSDDNTEIMFINTNYDPRLFLINNNTNKIDVNKFVYDGTDWSESDISNFKTTIQSYICDSDETLSSATDTQKSDFIEKHIPTKWFNKTQKITNPIWNDSNRTSGIFYASNSIINSTELTISDSNLRAIQGNEINKILEMKTIKNWFCPSDFFNYIPSSLASVKDVFASTNLQLGKASTSKYQKLIYENNGIFNQTLKDISTGGTFGGDDKPYALGYYLEGNPYTGLIGRVSPMLFDEADSFQSIEGIFSCNPQLLPYSYSGTKNGKYIMGELFEKDTFKSLTKLRNTYKLWANNIVPKQVRINPTTFQNKSNLQYLDYMFAGTIWFNSTEDDSIGYQLEQGFFKGTSNIVSARATFTPVVNYTYQIDESPVISYTSNITGGDPHIAGSYGETLNTGIYGVSWVPDNLFDDSSTSLDMISNMFFFDQNLTNYPDIFNYSGFKERYQVKNWDKKLYHTAYYLNANKLNQEDKTAFSLSGAWNLQVPSTTNNNGNVVYYADSNYNSYLN